MCMLKCQVSVSCLAQGPSLSIFCVFSSNHVFYFTVLFVQVKCTLDFYACKERIVHDLKDHLQN